MPQPQPSAQSQQPYSQQPAQPQPYYAPQPVPPNPAAAVSIRGLFKRFGNKIAVNGLSLDIPVGSFYGLVGPNGAGKTTTLNMVTGLLVPDAGLSMILGRNVWQDVNDAKRSIGVMPQPDQIFDRLTGLQLLVYAGMLRGMKRAEALSRAHDLLNAFDLAQAANTMVSDYSAGMTKKICLASAMIHSPRILVLDEPFESVDPVSSANLKDILIEYAGTGGTVIISSHVMSLVEKMCTHVAVINNGQVCAAGTVDQVAAGEDLEDRFLQLVGGRHEAAHLSWLDGGAPRVPASAGSPETSPTPVAPAPAQPLPNPTALEPSQSRPNPNETAVR
ncbi:ABC transporter ATP-binding protein [Bifidobacterium callitrichidarum]|uniref:ABC transporter ATP-binding protein n=1 Tax=Bifidobacterium callitrichidarum TaxID=2052941 RepID=A0A2U2N2Y1_9BIFI|nr:ABC transporter ATP-binding protein [Bifidobacterium callitrichidarum]PWG63601.1 ABC transporter ATP-binding protein [Bifidobacterium callitrichidarum]